MGFLKPSKELPTIAILQFQLRSLIRYYGLGAVCLACLSSRYDDDAMLIVALENLELTYPDHYQTAIESMFLILDEKVG